VAAVYAFSDTPGDEMKFRIEHKFVGTFDESVYFLTEENYFDPKNLPNVKDNKVLVEEVTEDRKFWKNLWSAHGRIPKLVQHIITPKMLSWIEETTYDRKAKTYFTKITPFYFRSVFFCQSRGYFKKLNDREFLRINDGVLDIKIPVFGPFIEEQIIKHLRENFENEFKYSYKVVKEKFCKK
jgi:hypothetical protein